MGGSKLSVRLNRSVYGCFYEARKLCSATRLPASDSWESIQAQSWIELCRYGKQIAKDDEMGEKQNLQIIMKNKMVQIKAEKHTRG